METILVELEKVQKIGRMDFDFYDPNQKEVTHSIVQGYTEDKLKNICLKVNTGKTAPRNSYPDEGIRIVKVKNTTGNGINWGHEFFVSPEFYEKAEKKARVQIGDVLMLCAAHNKVYIGRCDIVDSFPQEVIGDESRCCCVGELIIIRANPEKVIPEYLITYLRLPVVQEQIRRMVKGQSAHLYPKDLVNLDVILPPKVVQQEIAELNRQSEEDYLQRVSHAREALKTSRERMEDLIINGTGKK